MINPQRKILGNLASAKRLLGDIQMNVVLATGCFDLLHRGHVQLLVRAKLSLENEHSTMLVVAVNSDESIRSIKGKDRPVCPLSDRMYMVASLECVNAVFFFTDLTAAKAIRAARPKMWVKGGDWKLSELSQSERRAAKDVGAKIKIVPRIGEWSTTGLLRRL